MARICRHPLRIVQHLPQWLACDTCQASFLHREDCTSVGSPECAATCMNNATPDPDALLELLSTLPAHDRSDRG
jgi:hypothetical protein